MKTPKNHKEAEAAAVASTKTDSRTAAHEALRLRHLQEMQALAPGALRAAFVVRRAPAL